jgi:hypothetical protein
LSEALVSKKQWIIVAVVALVLLAVGILIGPRLYLRVFPPPTPYGWIAKVEAVDSFSGGQVKPASGYELWVVHFGPTVTVPPGIQAPKLIDDTGEKHPSVANQMLVDTSANLSIGQEVYSIPVGRKPRSLQFADAPPVPLPGPP